MLPIERSDRFGKVRDSSTISVDKVLYAKDEHGQLIEASKGAIAYCPGCGNRVRPKCGTMVAHHWAHISGGDCDTWSESEGPWHKGWKEYFPMHCREVVMGENNEHRADVRLDNGLVIELQHSTISSEMIAERERFYGSMVWLFDARGFMKNLEIRKSYYHYVALADTAVLEGIDKLAASIESKIQTAQAKLIEFSAAYEKVKCRIRELPVGLLEESYHSFRQEGPHSLIESFGNDREGLTALTKAAHEHRELIKRVLVNLPVGNKKQPPYFSLKPWHVFDYLISGELEDYRNIRKFQQRWQQRIWPNASREQRVIVGRLAQFIWHNVTASAKCYSDDSNKVFPTGWVRSARKDCWQDKRISSMIADSAIDNLGYLVAAKKLRIDVKGFRSEVSQRPDFWPSQLAIIKLPPFTSGLCTVRALKVVLDWKRRRKSLLTCDRPQLWDLGSDYLLYFEKLTYVEDAPYRDPMSGYLIKKVDFLDGVMST